MNKILSKMIFGAALLSLAACSQDEIMDDNALPDGKYPLEIASVSLTADVDEQPWGTKAAQTRVTENTDGTGSVWQEGDKIKVQIGNGTPGTYTYQSNGTLTVADGDRPAYWTSKESGQTIKAWYTSSGGETVDLSDQTNGLAYIVTAQTTANFNTAVSLSFSHQLAKVRVYLKGMAYNGSNDKGVTLSYPASCTVADGNVTSSGTNSTIQMHKVDNHYEALVPPGTITTDGNSFNVALNGNTSAKVNLSANLTLREGNKYDVTLKIHKEGTEVVDLSTLTQPYTITKDGYYYFTGSSSYGIKVTSGNPDIYLDDATISVSSGNAIHIAKGSPTIHVQGTNTISTSGGAGIYVAEDNTVTIKGNSREDKLTVTGNIGGAGIGGYSNNSDGTNYDCGNITINNVTLTAESTEQAHAGDYAAGIGSVGTAKVGNINISDATIYASGAGDDCNMGAAAIGGGVDGISSDYPTAFNITISNSTIHVSRGDSHASYIGAGGHTYEPTEYDVISTAKITNSTIYNESGTEITQ